MRLGTSLDDLWILRPGRDGMTVLYLHVGHSKTGTTWLQAMLSLSGEMLEAHGLVYPDHVQQRIRESAKIVLGNAPQLMVTEDAFRARLDSLGDLRRFRGVVFSSEELFPQLLTLPDPKAVGSIASEAGFSEVSILVFTRDPIGHAASLWQQYLKRGGGTASLEAFFGKYAVPLRVAEFLERYGKAAGFTLTLRNYSRWQDRLQQALADWLALPSDGFTAPLPARLNRSMTRAELAFQRSLNRYLGKAGALLSDALCERLPDMSPDDLRPALVVQEETWRRLQPAIARVHARVPEAEQYCCDILAPKEEVGDFTLTASQIEVITDALGAEIAWLKARLAEKDAPRG
jgi:hypothetical protein